MERNKIVEILTPIFREAFSDDELVLSDALNADDVENWGSLTNMTMLAMVEEEFGIHIGLQDLKSIETVGDLISTIQGKIQ